MSADNRVIRKGSDMASADPCPLCADLGMTLYHGSGDHAEVRSCSVCGTGLPIAPSDVPNFQEVDDDV